MMLRCGEKERERKKEIDREKETESGRGSAIQYPIREKDNKDTNALSSTC